jgi:hypothetical protein
VITFNAQMWNQVTCEFDETESLKNKNN